MIVAGEESLWELIELMESKPTKDLQKDAVLTLAWIAESDPEQVCPYLDMLVNNLRSPINRVVWGSMIALSHIAPNKTTELFHQLPDILEAMDNGTPVTRDYGFRILVVLYGQKEFQDDLFVIVLEQLEIAPKNQLGQYVERFAQVVMTDHKTQLMERLEKLMDELENEYHIKRLNRCLKKLRKK